MIRIGIIANTFDDTFGGLAGGHVHFIEVAKRWYDYSIVIFAPEIARTLIAHELPTADFIPMPSLRVWAGQRQLTTLFRTISAPLQVRALRSCDVLIATSQFLPDLIPALFARRRRFIATVPHLLDPPARRSGGLLANIISSLFQQLSIFLIRNYAPVLLVNSEQTARRIASDSSAIAIYVMTHGVDQAVNCSTTHVRDKDALFLGRLVPTKGVEDLLQAWHKIVKRLPTAKLTIAGNGNEEYVDTLKRLASLLELNANVHFTGRVSDERRSELFQTHRIFVFPSKEEGWGIVLAEAMANGLPCVTYNLTAYDAVFKRGRRSVNIGDIDAFAGTVIQIMTDGNILSQLASEALTLGKTFSWEQAADIERCAIQDAMLRAV